MVTDKKLYIHFHGRVIEHLGIDMYQSPVAAIAELISNSWDADATTVKVSLPETIKAGSEIVIEDDGEGMTLAQCQDRYLKVGYNRRADRDSERTTGGRPIMGRKGIGKFAGFGIADLLEVTTVSKETGERARFRLDITRLTGSAENSDYVDSSPMEVELLDYSPPDPERRVQHGTLIRLHDLTMKRVPNSESFRRSMAKRFLLLERAEEFQVTVDGIRIAEDEDEDWSHIEFVFPKDYSEDQRPAGLTERDGWGYETLSNGKEIRWRFVFYKEPIRDEDLSGISIFSHHKLAQRPFFFHLSGGMGAQQALNYLSGQVNAEYIDDQEKDLISTERQRINWDAEDALSLLEWGQERTKSLARIWQDRRASAKLETMNRRTAPFAHRLNKLESEERAIVKRALTSIARIPSLSNDDYADLANSMLAAWEGGRLKGLILKLAGSSDMDADELVNILMESRVMTALHAAERVKTQLNLINGLEVRVRNRELENAVRDYIADNPWIISPEWDTFRTERRIDNLVKECGSGHLDADSDWAGRVDLTLSSGSQLLIVEFMRPGVTADWDHLSRFERYIFTLRDAVSARSTLGFLQVNGLLVADRLERPRGFAEKLKKMKQDGMEATDWNGLLAKAKGQWQDYFDILQLRAPGDGRMIALAEETDGGIDAQGGAAGPDETASGT